MSKKRTSRRPKSQPPTPDVIGKANRMVERLRSHWETGREANELCNGSHLTTSQFAANRRLNENTVRKDRDFHQNFTTQELDELCRLRRCNSQLPLHWGYVPVLLTAGSRTKRRKFLQLAVREEWSVARLRREIHAARKPTATNQEKRAVGGRPMKPPDSVSEGRHQIEGELRVLAKRCEALIRVAKQERKTEDANLAVWLQQELQRLAAAIGQPQP